MKEIGFVLFGIYMLLTLWLFLNGLLQLHLWWLSKNKKETVYEALQQVPVVTIQLPVYNEQYVIEGLLQCLSHLNYPKESLEIVVLDDSTDVTSAIIDREVAALKTMGFAVSVHRRAIRSGYKAGALQANLTKCRGEYIALFDADFRPAPDFLQQMLPYFADSNVGIVQARWSHNNQHENFLTRIQSFLLDTFFSIEMRGRNNGGFFSNFCGTAGIWRKSCIEDAGGWDGEILSEDLDLSYRAQLKGWKVVYDHNISVPAELPANMEAFKIQQARWTKGIMQVCRKNGKAVLSAPLPALKKIHALFHLSGSFVFPCLFINSLLSLPLLLLRHHIPAFITLTNLASVGGLNLLLITIIFYQGVKSSNNESSFSKYFPVFLLVYMGLSVQNTVAVFKGLRGVRSPFVRTPKFADNKAVSTSYFPQMKNKTVLLELAMLLYYLGAIGISLYLGDYFYLLLFVMMSCGLAIILYHSVSWRSIGQPFMPSNMSWR